MASSKKIFLLVLSIAAIMLLSMAIIPRPISAQAERKNVFVGAWPYLPPPEGHFNTFVTNAITLGVYLELIQEPLAWYIWYNNTYIPCLATSWELKGDNFIVHLRKGVRWHNGDPFTAKDVISTFYILYMLRGPVWGYIDKVTALDDYTVAFHISKPSSILIRFVLRTDIRPYSTYGQYSDKVLKLISEGYNVTSKPMSDLVAQFRKYRPKEYIGTGPFMWTGEITSSEVWLKKNPDYWNKKAIRFDWIKLYNGETPVVTPIVLAKKVDYATHGFPPATVKQFLKEGIKVYKPPTLFGPALFFNYKVYPFNMTGFRQALDYAVNKTENAYVSLLQYAAPVTVPTGLPFEVEKIWLTQNFKASLTEYKYDPAKAASMLEKLGFKKGADGIWVAPNGKKMTFELIFPAEYADWSAAAEDLAAQLTKFGIKITLRGITFTEIYHVEMSGKWQLAIAGWGSGNPFPFFSYYNEFIYLNYPTGVGPGMSYELVRTTKCCGKVNITGLIYKTGVGFDKNTQEKYVEELAKVYDEQLPQIPLWERYGDNPVLDGVRVTGWPPPQHWIWRQSLYSDNPVVLMIALGIYIHPVGWTPPTTIIKTVIPKGLNESVTALKSTVSSLKSTISTLTSTVNSLKSSVSSLSSQISSIASIANTALWTSVISIIIAIIAIAVAFKKPKTISKEES